MNAFNVYEYELFLDAFVHSWWVYVLRPLSFDEIDHINHAFCSVFLRFFSESALI